MKMTLSFFLCALCVCSVCVVAGCGSSKPIALTLNFTGTAAIDAGQSLNITVTGAGSKGVMWSLASFGTLSAQTTTSVTYNAAASVTAPVTDHLTATSLDDSTKTVTLAITDNATPSISTTQAQLTNSPATAGNAYSFTFAATGGSGTLTWTATGLPSWLSISAGGVLSGTPPAAGTFNFTVTVTDSSVAGAKSATSGQLTLTVNQAPVLSITKTHVGNFTRGQNGATYTVTVSNGAAGGSTNGTTVTVTETVPSGLTLVSMAGTGWTCASGGTTCTRSDVLAPASSYPAITVTVNVSATATSPQVNQVSVSGGGLVNAANTSDSTTILAPVLAISKTHTGSFNLGQQGATYTVTVSNIGSAPTSGTVTVTETPPSGETLVSMAGTGWTCPASGTTCTRTDALANGSSYPSITVTVNVSATATSPQVNSVMVSGGTSATANVSDSTTILFPALGIAKTHTGNFNLGQTGATYTVTVSNTGAAPTVGTVTVTDTVSSGETLVTMVGVGWTCGTPNAANVCTRSDALANGASYPAITVTVNVAANATSPQVNHVSVSGGGALNPASANDSTTILLPVLAIAKTHTGNFTQGQSGATYTVTVSNTGAAATVGTVTVTDTVPSGETLVTLAGVGWTCGTPNAANVCTRTDALANGSSYPSIIVTVNVSSSASTPQVNSVSVSGGGSASASTTDSTTIVEPVLGITKTHTGNFTQGQLNATYTVTVSNTGTAPTSGTVTVTDTLPSGLTLVSMAGTGWTCATNSCTRADVLATASSYPAITVTVNVASNATTPQTNKVDVSGGGSVAASASDPTTIIEPVLAITKTHTGNFTQGQQNATYTVTVDNNGGTASTSGTVTVTETVPSGLTLVSMSGTGWTCASGGTTCTRSDVLAVGASYPAITVTVNVGNSASSPQVNNVSVSGGGSASASAMDSTTINATLMVTTTSGSLPTGTVNTAYPNTSLAATGGIQPYSWMWVAASGSQLPPGLSLSTGGQITGTPTLAGTFNVVVTVTDSATPTHNTATASLSITVNAAAGACTSGGSESLLSGGYAMVLKGFDSSGNPVLIGGVLTFNGSGSITAGTIDMNLAAGPSLNLNVTSGSYGVNTSDHRGCMVITTSAGTQNFRFSLGNISGTPAAASTGHVIGFDTTGPFTAGIMRKQSGGPFSNMTANGTFAFGGSSVQNAAQGGGKFGLVGVITFNGSGGITGGSEDINQNGTLDGNAANTTWPASPLSFNSATSSYNIAANGRGSEAIGVIGTPVIFNSLIYVVSSSEALFMTSDSQTIPNHNISAGVALLQTGAGSFTNSSASGTYAGYTTALGSAGAGTTDTEFILVNIANPNITGNVLGNDAGTISTMALSNITYNVASSGRTTLSGAGVGNHAPLLLIVDSNHLFFLNSNGRVNFGFFQSQTSTSASGTYAFGGIDPEDKNISDDSGVAGFASPSINITQDKNSSGTLTVGGMQSATFSIDPNGLIHFPSGCTIGTNCSTVGLVISPTRLAVFDLMSTNPKIDLADQ